MERESALSGPVGGVFLGGSGDLCSLGLRGGVSGASTQEEVRRGGQGGAQGWKGRTQEQEVGLSFPPAAQEAPPGSCRVHKAPPPQLSEKIFWSCPHPPSSTPCCVWGFPA